MSGVLVTGTVSAPHQGPVLTLPRPITGEIEIYLPNCSHSRAAPRNPPPKPDEVGHVVDQTIDIEQSIVDAVGLALPFAPVCSDDCRDFARRVRCRARDRRDPITDTM